MKNLLIIASFVVVPFFSGTAMAGGCQHGNYALEEHENLEPLIAADHDSEALALLRKQLEEKEATVVEEVVYN